MHMARCRTTSKYTYRHFAQRPQYTVETCRQVSYSNPPATVSLLPDDIWKIAQKLDTEHEEGSPTKSKNNLLVQVQLVQENIKIVLSNGKREKSTAILSSIYTRVRLTLYLLASRPITTTVSEFSFSCARCVNNFELRPRASKYADSLLTTTLTSRKKSWRLRTNQTSDRIKLYQAEYRIVILTLYLQRLRCVK